jgi:short-subunit dehydrogenase
MSNRLAAITGASAGLGTVFARKLAGQGYDLLLIARRGDRLQMLADDLSRPHGIAAAVHEADLSTEDGIASTAARLAAEERLHLLVNNAGFGTVGRFHELDAAAHTAMHRVHMDATMRLSHAALPGMVARNAGAIVNVASVAGFLRSPANVSYCATKAWINAFTEGLYLELAGLRSNVTVQALCPGFTYTEFHDVVGIDRAQIPKWLWMPADFVVDASLAAIPSRKLYVIPGLKYRVIVAVVTKMPAWLRLKLEARSPQSRNRL